MKESGTFKIIVIMAIMLFAQHLTAQQYTVTSPNGRLAFRVAITTTTSYEVLFDGESIIAPSQISVTLNNGIVLGNGGTVQSTSETSVDEIINLVHGKSKTLTDHYTQRVINFTDSYSLVIRAYDEGVAYRFQTALPGNVNVMSEMANFNFVQSPSVIFPEADGNMYSWEREYIAHSSLTNIANNKFSITPTLYTYDNKGIRILIAESDQRDYPGMYLERNGGSGVRGKWAYYPKTVTDPENLYAYHRVITRENYMATTSGTRTYPWRIIIATDDDKELLTNSLIFKLSPPQVLSSTSWISTGKSAWEWWHDALLENPQIPSGPSNLSFQLYQVYIDFAAQYELEFITMDAGWQDSFVAQVCQYAASKNVKVILWDFINLAVVNPNRLTQLKNYGAAGVKVDLIERDDQEAIKWVEKLASDCADRGLLLILHGCAKPTGLERMYPNIVNYEAVRGEECAKWDYTVNPNQRLYIPFVRMPAGPLDYTPGSMRNVHRSQFNPVPQGIPMTIGTRAHELALFVIFDQPLTFLSDSPTEYRKSTDAMRFLSKVPTTWDETLPLSAKVGEHAVMARRKGEEWYVGVISNEQARTVEVDFSFLPAGETRTAEVYRDNEFTSVSAKLMQYEVISVTNQIKLNLSLTAGGGAAIRVRETTVTGIEEDQKSTVRVYQNNDRTRLTIESTEIVESVTLIDMAGRTYRKEVILSQEMLKSMDVSQLPQGLYVVLVQTRLKMHAVKIAH